MRLRKALLIVVALAACLAVGSASVATAKTKKIQTTIVLTVTSTGAGPYTPASTTANGSVSARGPRGCTKGRTVLIFRNGVSVATVKTGESGQYSVTITGLSSGNWQAGVTKRVIKKKKKHKKFVCRPAATGVVVIP